MINNRPLKGLLCKLGNMLDAETPQYLKEQIRQELEALSGIVIDNTLHKYYGHCIWWSPAAGGFWGIDGVTVPS
jgi:hypothetical protein